MVPNCICYSARLTTTAIASINDPDEVPVRRDQLNCRPRLLSRPAELKPRRRSDVGQSDSESLTSAGSGIAALQLPSLLFPTETARRESIRGLIGDTPTNARRR